MRKIPPAMYPSFAASPADVARPRTRPSSTAWNTWPSRAAEAFSRTSTSRTSGRSRRCGRWTRSRCRGRRTGARRRPDPRGFRGLPEHRRARRRRLGLQRPGAVHRLLHPHLRRQPHPRRPVPVAALQAAGRPGDRLRTGRGAAAGATPTARSPPTTPAQQIEGGKLALAGQELVWLDEPVGGVRDHGAGLGPPAAARRPDLRSRLRRHQRPPLRQPGRQMVADGVITRRSSSPSPGCGRTSAAPPRRDMDKYLWLNPRTTFFAERPGGPFGKLNVPVTPLAHDRHRQGTDVYPPGDARVPGSSPSPTPARRNGR